MKKILKTVPYLVVALLVGVTASYAGSLTPPGAPAQSMYKLSDLYELINTGANTPDTTFTTPGSISATMNSIGDIYDLMTSKIDDIDGTQILTGTTIFGVDGSASAETPAPTFAGADATQYKCEWLTVDPAQPAVTLETICGYHVADGCSWTGSACGGSDELKTPASGYMTWYAGKATCANSTEDAQTAGTWRLPTYLELVKHYLDNNNAGNPPTGFAGDYYWSDTTHPSYSNYAYNVDMYGGDADDGGKSSPYYLVHCAH